MTYMEKVLKEFPNAKVNAVTFLLCPSILFGGNTPCERLDAKENWTEKCKNCWEMEIKEESDNDRNKQ